MTNAQRTADLANHPSRDGGRMLVDRYLNAGHDFRIELGAHACRFEDGVCVLNEHGVTHGGRLWQLTQTEVDVLIELFGADGVAAAQVVLGLRYGTLTEVDPVLPGVVYPLVTAAPPEAGVPMHKWQGSYADVALGVSRTTYGPGFVDRRYADRYLVTVQARSAAERREVGRPEYDRWRLLYVQPLVRIELVEER